MYLFKWKYTAIIHKKEESTRLTAVIEAIMLIEVIDAK